MDSKRDKASQRENGLLLSLSLSSTSWKRGRIVFGRFSGSVKMRLLRAVASRKNFRQRQQFAPEQNLVLHARGAFPVLSEPLLEPGGVASGEAPRLGPRTAARNRHAAAVSALIHAKDVTSSVRAASVIDKQRHGSTGNHFLPGWLSDEI